VEHAFLEFVARQQQSLPPGTIGIGDDAAVIPIPGSSPWVVCTDLISDETDFHLADVTPAQIGRKALAINLSDIAAMACRPTAAFLTLLLPQGAQSLDLAKGIYRGALELGQSFQCPILGGDTNTWPGKVAVSVTVLGVCPGEGPLLRRGAKPGDEIFVTGKLGGSILGHHLTFLPRVEEAILLRKQFGATAGMDLSDGLSVDLPRLCLQSGVGAEIDLARLPISEDGQKRANTTGKPKWWHAVNDGEDFELLFTVSPENANRLTTHWRGNVPVTRIGKIVADPGVFKIDEQGHRSELTSEGFSHQ